MSEEWGWISYRDHVGETIYELVDNEAQDRVVAIFTDAARANKEAERLNLDIGALRYIVIRKDDYVRG